MSESIPLPGWRVESLTVKRGGSIDVTVSYNGSERWYVAISRDGEWDIVNDLGEPPVQAKLTAIMTVVSNYSIRRTFGGE